MEVIEITINNGDKISTLVEKENDLYHALFDYKGDIIHACSSSVENLKRESEISFDEYFEFCRELEN